MNTFERVGVLQTGIQWHRTTYVITCTVKLPY